MYLYISCATKALNTILRTMAVSLNATLLISALIKTKSLFHSKFFGTFRAIYIQIRTIMNIIRLFSYCQFQDDLRIKFVVYLYCISMHIYKPLIFSQSCQLHLGSYHTDKSFGCLFYFQAVSDTHLKPPQSNQ